MTDFLPNIDKHICEGVLSSGAFARFDTRYVTVAVIALSMREQTYIGQLAQIASRCVFIDDELRPFEWWLRQEWEELSPALNTIHDFWTKTAKPRLGGNK